jgi:molybdopterin synthase sulfur carrier subunit
MNMLKEIQIDYFAILREERGISSEKVFTSRETPSEIYAELQEQHNFSLSVNNLRIAINGEFDELNTPLKDGDCLVFIPPVAGG